MKNQLAEEKTAARLRSMTGFAQTVVHEDGMSLAVSLRSVNHRGLDLHLTLPEQLQRLEPTVRKEVQARHPRGHLQLRVTLQPEGARSPSVDEELIGKYIDLFRRVGEHYALPLDSALTYLPQLPGVIAEPSSIGSPQLSPQLEGAFLKALRDTLQNWDEMRVAEGEILQQDLRTRGELIRKFTNQAEQSWKQMVPLAQKKLQERLQTWLGQAGLDPGRLAQEAAMLAEHADISEELLRLKAHATQFLDSLQGASEIGKKLDFLLQEMQRELNTLMAKTAGLGEASLPLTKLALEMKGEVEKLREQVQNVQ